MLGTLLSPTLNTRALPPSNNRSVTLNSADKNSPLGNEIEKIIGGGKREVAGPVPEQTAASSFEDDVTYKNKLAKLVGSLYSSEITSSDKITSENKNIKTKLEEMFKK